MALSTYTKENQRPDRSQVLRQVGVGQEADPALAQAIKSAVSRVSAPSAVVASQPGWALTVCEVC